MVRCLALAIALFLAEFATAKACDGPSCFEAAVVAVADGDTVTVLHQTTAGPRQVRVRLTEIDAPERGQPWGTRARQALADKVFGRTVWVAADGEDRYGRLLARLHVADGETRAGRDVNRELVREGHAWVYRRYATENWLPDEAAARESGLGLWSLGADGSIPPWEWRRGERASKVAAIDDAPTGIPASAAHQEPFSCGTKRTCGEMTSCVEARFHLLTCGLARLDRDRDGQPCERLCRQ